MSTKFSFAFLLLGAAAILTTEFLVLSSYPVRAADVIYVDANASGLNNGSSWDDAYINLQDALSTAISGDEIWVAADVYTPTNTTGHNATFQLKNGVALYGGFAGTETARDQRDWETHITVLSGDVDSNDTTDANGIVTDPANIVGDNAYHVVTGSGTNSTAILDGFTITGGKTRTEAIWPDHRGGGLFNDHGNPTLANLNFIGNTAIYGGGIDNYYSSPTLTNVAFNNNSGSGISNYYGNPTLNDVTFDNNIGSGMLNSSSDPTLNDVVFRGNTAGSGGGMYNIDSSPTLVNVAFIGNVASNDGGGMYNQHYSTPSLINVIFSGNRASHDGGGVYSVDHSTLALTNVTLSGNVASNDGGGMSNQSDSGPTLANCILWNNNATYNGDQIDTGLRSSSDISYSLIQDGCPTGATCDNLLTSDPQFVDANGSDNVYGTLDDDLRLRYNSPAINAGDNNVVTVSTDLAGNPRIMRGIVDIGAYEVETVRINSPVAETEIDFAPVCGSVYFTNTGTLPTYIDVILTHVTPLENNSGLPRRYDIQVNGGSGHQARLTLCYEDDELAQAGIDAGDESNLAAFRWGGSEWEEHISQVDTANNTVTVPNVTAFSPWGIDEGTPTAVTLASFTAAPQAGGILVAWETAIEIDTVGFNLYRSTSPGGPYVRLNTAFIPSQSPGSVFGATYTWLDEDVKVGITYYYKLEDIEVGGKRTFHGPIATQPAGPTALVLRSLGTRNSLAAASLTLLGICGLLSMWRMRKRK